MPGLAGRAAWPAGPYQDTTPGRLGLTSVDTPDPATILFHLRQPFADFDYVVAIPQTVPVPRARDTGANYQLHPVSTGPYMFQDYRPSKQFTLVRNPYWNPATDPSRQQRPDAIMVNLNINSATINNNLIHNYAQVDLTPGGVQAAAQGQILQDPALKAHADDVPTEAVLFTYINTKVKPLDNVHCRRAVEYAADKAAYQTAYGGPVGGDIASTVLPRAWPAIRGSTCTRRPHIRVATWLGQGRSLRPAASRTASPPPWPSIPTSRKTASQRPRNSRRCLGSGST